MSIDAMLAQLSQLIAKLFSLDPFPVEPTVVEGFPFDLERLQDPILGNQELADQIPDMSRDVVLPHEDGLVARGPGLDVMNFTVIVPVEFVKMSHKLDLGFFPAL